MEEASGLLVTGLYAVYNISKLITVIDINLVSHLNENLLIHYCSNILRPPLERFPRDFNTELLGIPLLCEIAHTEEKAELLKELSAIVAVARDEEMSDLCDCFGIIIIYKITINILKKRSHNYYNL